MQDKLNRRQFLQRSAAAAPPRRPHALGDRLHGPARLPQRPHPARDHRRGRARPVRAAGGGHGRPRGGGGRRLRRLPRARRARDRAHAGPGPRLRRLEVPARGPVDRRGDRRHARPLAPDPHRGGAARGQTRLPREADDAEHRGRPGDDRGRQGVRTRAAGRQPGHELEDAGDGARHDPRGQARTGHDDPRQLQPQQPQRGLALSDPARREREDGGLARVPRSRRRSGPFSLERFFRWRATGTTPAASPPTSSCTC